MKDQFVGFNLDFAGFSVSLFCALHCAALPFLLSLAPLSALQYLNYPWIEYIIIIASFFIAWYTLVHSYNKHHKKPLALVIVVIGFILIGTGHLLQVEWKEIIITFCGALLVGIAHFINWKHTSQHIKFSDRLQNKISE